MTTISATNNDCETRFLNKENGRATPADKYIVILSISVGNVRMKLYKNRGMMYIKKHNRKAVDSME